MRPRHYILKGTEVVPVKSIKEWGLWFGTHDNTVAKTQVGDLFVSTIFLGLDMSVLDGPPLLFETMVFDSERDPCDYMRYATWKEAEIGHARMVNVARMRVESSNALADAALKEAAKNEQP